MDWLYASGFGREVASAVPLAAVPSACRSVKRGRSAQTVLCLEWRRTCEERTRLLTSYKLARSRTLTCSLSSMSKTQLVRNRPAETGQIAGPIYDAHLSCTICSVEDLACILGVPSMSPSMSPSISPRNSSWSFSSYSSY